MLYHVAIFARRVAGHALWYGVLVAYFVAAATVAQPRPALPPPIDPQIVQDQDDMTWDDYRPIPGVNWTDPKHVPERTIRIALVAADFEDQPFVITLPKQSDLFGNPQIDHIPRAEVARFYRDFWNRPQEINHHHTVHEYWMELSHGKIGVEIDAYGPYRMPQRMIDYPGTVNEDRGPAGGTGSSNIGPRPSLGGDLDALWRPDANGKEYDLVLRIYAGYDETCVWQEFGEMKFQTRDDIPPEWGHPDPLRPRWSRTRYVDWTSWKAASYLWSNSSIIQGESSGSIRHEIAHAAFSIGDNNNNPYVQPYHRAGSGPWDIMDRGSFNGPRGPHHRWQVPVTYGGAMPAGVMLSQQMKFGFLRPSNVVRLNRDELARSGLMVAKVVPRNVAPGTGELHGIAVALDGDGDRTPAQDADANPLYGGTGYNYYTLEVVQRMGYDSFSPDSGVLIAMNTGSIGDREELPQSEARRSGRGGRRGAGMAGMAGGQGGRRPLYFNWVIDAHPEDMHRLDFRRPNGEPVMRSIADYRQLNDALFHAGLGSGSEFEYVDRPNGLHFYVIDLERDANGIRTYTLGVRSLDGGGHERGVLVSAPTERTTEGVYHFQLSNTGTARPIDAALHLQETARYANYDIYRLSVAVEGDGWSAKLQNGLAAVEFGEEASVPVFVTPGKSANATVRLTATSESDRSKTSTATFTLGP
jgi:M6 family metalloprotease-like protein